MALIFCPECGEQISEKAVKCIHCGAVLKEEPKLEKKCLECGEILDDIATTCPHCGCPVVAGEEITGEPQKVEVVNVKLKMSRVKRILIIVAIAVIIFGCVGGFFVKRWHDKKTTEAYKENLQTAVITMLSGAAKAESSGNLIHKVWKNAIYKESDDETDEYTKGKYDTFVDFNTALSNLFADSTFDSDISQIKRNQETVQSLMKDLQNPPAEYEDAYAALKKFYNSYTELVGCAVNPTGSLTTFTSTFNDADTETMNCYKEMALYTED